MLYTYLQEVPLVPNLSWLAFIAIGCLGLSRTGEWKFSDVFNKRYNCHLQGQWAWELSGDCEQLFSQWSCYLADDTHLQIYIMALPHMIPKFIHPEDSNCNAWRNGAEHSFI
jgi:hypothetical protein